MKYVYLKLTEKEAGELYIAAHSRAEEINEAESVGAGYSGGTGHDRAAFWRALEKLQTARRKAGGIY